MSVVLPKSHIVSWSQNLKSVGTIYTYNRSVSGEFTTIDTNMIQSIIAIRVVNSDFKPYNIRAWWYDSTNNADMGDITSGFILVPPKSTLYLKGAAEYSNHDSDIRFMMGGQSTGPDFANQKFFTVTVTASYALPNGGY